MRVRWQVLVARDYTSYGRTFGNFDALSDAEALAGRIRKHLADGYGATAIPYFQGITSARAALVQMPSYYLKKEGS